MSKSFVGSVYSPNNSVCDCGGSYHRLPHPNHGILVPYCEDCGEISRRFKLVRKIGKLPMKFSHNENGDTLRTIEEVIRVSAKITRDLKKGTFSPEAYHRKNYKGTMGETVGEFISRVAVKVLTPNPEDPDREILEDYLGAYMGDVGIFAACDVHLEWFLKTFHLKFKGDEKKAHVRSLFWKVKDLAAPNYLAA